jgi:hypothetical protein
LVGKVVTVSDRGDERGLKGTFYFFLLNVFHLAEAGPAAGTS